MRTKEEMKAKWTVVQQKLKGAMKQALRSASPNMSPERLASIKTSWRNKLRHEKSKYL